ncbi:MAG: hypothetical protein IKL22_11040 [Lachnospiraceae bacterium]|nr:hypothetical protein [Lachnospiraceae bacterium]
MLKQEVNIYKEIQRNTEAAMKAIDAVSDKVFDEKLATQISKQSLEYAQIRNQAYDKLLEAKADPYRSSYAENLKLAGGIQYNTLFNTSTSRIAEVMIKGCNEGVLKLNRVLNHNSQADEQALGLAQRLMQFEEKNIRQFTKYL